LYGFAYNLALCGLNEKVNCYRVARIRAGAVCSEGRSRP